MDGTTTTITTITCPKLMMDSAKVPPIFVESRPKRQRPTHQGEFISFGVCIKDG